MSNSSFGQRPTPEHLTIQVAGLIDRASRLDPQDLVLRDAEGHRNELHVGEGYLSSLRKPGGDIVDVGATINPGIEGKFPARTVIKKENALGVLIVAAEGDTAQTLEGTFDGQKNGKGIVDLDGEKTTSVAAAALSALENEIAQREKILAHRIDGDIDTLIKA